MNTQPNAVSASALLNLSRPEKLADSKINALQQGDAFKDIFASESGVKPAPASGQASLQQKLAEDRVATSKLAEKRTQADRVAAEQVEAKRVEASRAEAKNAEARRTEQTAAARRQQAGADEPVTERANQAAVSDEAKPSVAPSTRESGKDPRADRTAPGRDNATADDAVEEAATPLVAAAAGTEQASLTLNLPADTHLSLMTVSDAVAGAATELESRLGDGGENPLAALIAMIAAGDPGQNPAAAATPALTPAAADTTARPLRQWSSLSEIATAAAELGEESSDGLLSELSLEELTTGLKAESLAGKADGTRLPVDMSRPADASLLAQLASQATTQPAASKAFASQLQESVKGVVEGAQPRVNLGAAVAELQTQPGTNRASGQPQFTLPGDVKGAVGQPEWHTAVAERVAIMATKRLSSAEIQLDPPELGQLQVRVTLNQDQASVSFASQHAVVREALDQTAFRLREMFEAEGFNLLDVDVSDQSFQQQGQQQQQLADGGVAGEADGAGAEVETLAVSNQLVDHFV
ncbi:hypothetical protein G8764_19110 [Pseudomaricurvus alcaniphilus]|uniref:flagellar hook-length control protein FliK n=1 Tax=Pseudomaricurvus alcaniphilus TaxID=1166482 RepID=UPI00140B7C3A|nr:flagellar hook-length control protein FliK [Pseudomaricurvus alcaniphilus]NHN39421.1 hypothetical protein [Pseudomaricurvus alcaniphilus]